MPLYAYACTTCEHQFEALVFDGDEVECPECRGVLHSLRRMLVRLHNLPTSAHGASDFAQVVRQRLHEPPAD